MKVINLFAGPGAGKSTTAAGLFYLMKTLGHRVELVTEYAKELVYEGRPMDQTDILAEQTRRLRRLVGKVDWAVSDSPILMQTNYAPFWLCEAIRITWRQFDNVNFLIIRHKPYAEYGRLQTEREALHLDHLIRRTLDGCGGPYTEVPGGAEAPALICKALGLG